MSVTTKTIKLIGKSIVDKNSSLRVCTCLKIENGTITMTNLNTTVVLKTDISGNRIISFKDFEKTENADIAETNIPLDDFPGVPEFKEEEKTGEISPNIFNENDLSVYKQAVATDEKLACLTGISISEKGMCSTDARRVVYNKSLTAECDVILMSETITVIEQLKKAGELVLNCVIYDNKYIELKTQNATVISKLIEGPYPDWRKVIPQNGTKTYLLQYEVSAIKTSLEKIFPFVCPGTKHNKNYHIVFYKDYIYAKNPNTNKHVKVKLPFQVFEQAMAFNCKYLIEILNSVTGECTIQYGTRISAVLFNDTFLLMPSCISYWNGKEAVACLNDNNVELFFLNVPFTEMAVETVTVKKPSMKNQFSEYYLFQVDCLFGITKNPAMPGMMKRLSETEFKQLKSLGVSIEAEIEVESLM